VRGLQFDLLDEVGGRALDGGAIDRFQVCLPASDLF
jgi:hypothetical protein